MFYRKTSENPSQYKTLETDQLGISLTNLEKFTEYCVQLAGFTRIGDGNKSRCFNVTTDEDGESIFASYWNPNNVKNERVRTLKVILEYSPEHILYKCTCAMQKLCNGIFRTGNGLP